MHRDVLAACPGVLDDRGLADVGDLFDDVEFAETVVLGGFTGQGINTTLVFFADVLDVAQPVVGEAHAFAAQHGAHAAAAVVAHDHDVFDFQHIDGELDHRETIQIGVDDDVGDVAVDEDFAGQQADDFVGGYAAVGAADPQVLGVLLAGEFLKKLRVALGDLGGPSFILGEEVRQVCHWKEGGFFRGGAPRAICDGRSRGPLESTGCSGPAPVRSKKCQ